MTNGAAFTAMGSQSTARMHDRAEVFISYSRFRPGDHLCSNSDRDATRWRARKVTLDLIRVIEKTIDAAGYQCWRDEPSLTEGDQFACKIDAALLSCAGAVIFLDPDALERSSWVRWESAILTWRQRISMPVRVVPVLIGVAPEELNKYGYEPSRLGQTLAHVIDLAAVDVDNSAYPGELERHASQIVEALGELEAEPTGPISVWIRRIAACLPVNSDLWRAVLELEIPRGKRLRLSARPACVVARELLAADRDAFERIVNAFYGFPFTDAVTLKLNLQPVWVPANVATGIAEAKDRLPGKRIIAVNATEPGTGADVVRRALPRASSRQRLEWTITSVTIKDAVEEARRKIAKKWIGGPGRTVDNLGCCFLVVSCGGSPTADLAQIVAELASAYPSLTFVVMVGDTEPEYYERLEPGLPQNADEEARSFEAMLDDLLMFR
jgi:hypothetical protein